MKPLLLKQTLSLIFIFFLAGCQQESDAIKTWAFDKEGVFTSTLSNHGKYVLIASTQGAARLINIEKNEPLHEWQHTDSNNGMIATAISGNNKFALTAEKESLALWETESGKIIGYWSFPNINAVAISNNGTRAIIGMESGEAYYFDLYYGKILQTFNHEGMINTVALSEENDLAITGGNDHLAKLWSLSTGELTQEWRHHFKIYKVNLSDDGNVAMSNDSLGKTRLWNTKNGQQISELPMRYMTVSASDFSPDAKTLLTGRPNQRIDLWDVKTGQLLKTWIPQKRYFWRPDTAAIISLQFNETGTQFYSSASSGITQKWSVKK